MKWTVFSGMTSSAVSVIAITDADCSCRIRQAFSPKISPCRSVASGYSVPSSRCTMRTSPWRTTYSRRSSREPCFRISLPAPTRFTPTLRTNSSSSLLLTLPRRSNSRATNPPAELIAT